MRQAHAATPLYLSGAHTHRSYCFLAADKAQNTIPVKTKNRITIRVMRLSTRTEIFHCKKKATRKNSTSTTPSTGKIYRMLSRSAGVEGRGALLIYSISVSSCSILKTFLPCYEMRSPQLTRLGFQGKQEKTK